MNVETNWLTSMAGAGIGIMSAGSNGPIAPGDALLYGTPLAIAGIVTLFWTRRYVPF